MTRGARSMLERRPSPPTRLPYRVRTIGRLRDQPYHGTRGTYHDDAMLTVFLSGRGAYRRGGAEFRVKPGMLGLVLPGGDPGLLLADPGDPYDHFYCRFAGGEALRTAGRIVSEHCGEWPFYRPPSWETLTALLRQMGALGAPASGGRPERLAQVDALLAELLALLDNPQPPVEKALTAAALDEYLWSHLAEPAGLAPVADHFGVSRAHLCRRARALLGENLVAAWERRKMDWARVLLRERELSVRDVARRVGYADPFYFSKVFKRNTGLSPGRWRRAR